MDTVHLSKNNITTNKKLQRTEHFRSFYIRQSFYSARVRVFSQLCSGQITFSNKFPEGASFKNVSVWKSREADIKCVTLNRNERNSAIPRTAQTKEVIIRSCYPEMFCKKDVLENPPNFTGKLRKAEVCNVIKKETLTGVAQEFLGKNPRGTSCQQQKIMFHKSFNRVKLKSANQNALPNRISTLTIVYRIKKKSNRFSMVCLTVT